MEQVIAVKPAKLVGSCQALLGTNFRMPAAAIGGHKLMELLSAAEKVPELC